MNNTPTTHTLEAPGAVIAYDVREAANGNGGPPLMMVGEPLSLIHI